MADTTITQLRTWAVRRALEGTGDHVTVDEIARRMRDNGDGHLIRVSSPSQALGRTLREMERAGEVDRVRRGYHKWGLIR